MMLSTDPSSEATSDSRTLLLAVLLDRRMPRYFPSGPPSAEAERRVILAVASDALPAAYPPSAEETAFCQIIIEAVSRPSLYRAH